MIYKVKPGETIYDVAYNTSGSLSTVDQIMDLNGLGDYSQDLTMFSLEVPDEILNNAARLKASNFPFNSSYLPSEQTNQLIDEFRQLINPEIIYFSLVYTLSGPTNQSVSEEYAEGTTATIKSPEALGMQVPETHNFTGWTINGSPIAIGDTIMMNANQTVTSTLEEIPLPADDFVEIAGIKWSRYLLSTPGTFADDPSDIELPKMYKFNNNVPWPVTGVISNWDTTNYNTGSPWSPANDPSPDGWRIPTETEFQSLIDNTTKSVSGGNFIHTFTSISDPTKSISIRSYSTRMGPSSPTGLLMLSLPTSNNSGASNIRRFTMSTPTNAAVGNAVGTIAMTILPVKTGDDVEIAGIRWSKYPVGTPGTFASVSRDQIRFYKYNNNNPWPSVGTITDWNSTNYATGQGWQTLNDPSPAGWKVPTIAQLQSLKDNTNLTEDAASNSFILTDKTNPQNTLIIPRMGYRVSNEVLAAGTAVIIWAYDEGGSNGSRCMIIGSNGIDVSDTLPPNYACMLIAVRN